MPDTKQSLNSVEGIKHALPAKPMFPLLLLPARFIAGVAGAGPFEVIGRAQGWLPPTFIPPSLWTGCAALLVVYGAGRLRLARRSQKLADFLATLLASGFALAPFFIGFCAVTFSALALTLNGLLDTSEPQAHRSLAKNFDIQPIM